MSPRKYAQGTSVEVGKTRGEMIGLLESYGASHYGFGREPEGDVLFFKIGRLNYKMIVPEPDQKAMKQAYIDQQSAKGNFYESTIRDRANRIDWHEQAEAEKRRLWRLRLIWLKATLEFAVEGGETAQTLLLPFMVLPGGQQVKEWAAETVERLDSGEVVSPPLMLG